MYFTIIAFVLALLFPTFAVTGDQSPQPAEKAGCCQMHGEHAGHGDAPACCGQGDMAKCKECKDRNCAECCEDGECTNGCCNEGCCQRDETRGEPAPKAGCCNKPAPGK